MPKTINSDQEINFLSHFWRRLWGKFGIKLQFSLAGHPQTDGRIEVVNRSLGNLLRCFFFFGKNIQKWDLTLTQAEFAFNRSWNQATGKSPFEIVYGLNPLVELAPQVPSVVYNIDGEQRVKIQLNKISNTIIVPINTKNLCTLKWEIWFGFTCTRSGSPRSIPQIEAKGRRAISHYKKDQ